MSLVQFLANTKFCMSVTVTLCLCYDNPNVLQRLLCGSRHFKSRVVQQRSHSVVGVSLCTGAQGRA